MTMVLDYTVTDGDVQVALFLRTKTPELTTLTVTTPESRVVPLRSRCMNDDGTETHRVEVFQSLDGDSFHGMPTTLEFTLPKDCSLVLDKFSGDFNLHFMKTVTSEDFGVLLYSSL